MHYQVSVSYMVYTIDTDGIPIILKKELLTPLILLI